VRPTKAFCIGTAFALLPAAINIAFAIRIMATRNPSWPSDFFDLYVRLRHPHHYDPTSWPAWLWIAFVLPIVPAAWVLLRRERIARLLVFFLALTTFALATWKVDGIAQTSLFRFSIYLKLLSCVGVAMVAERWMKPAVAIAIVLMIGCLIRGPYFGLFSLRGDSDSYLRACDSVRAHTDADAIFIVPPNEQEFRLRTQRAIVVNFKAVPQLSGELPEWRDRLEDVLGWQDLSSLPRGSFPAALAAMRDRYDTLPIDHFRSLAGKYHARYLLSSHRYRDAESCRIDLDGNDSWFLYDLVKQEAGDGDR
jgi:hypothetical protein